VPFVRVSRDKRGYEHVYLFEVSNRRPSKPRILYWFRTPPGVRVGREPFDEPVRRALEAQNPNVTFDWKKLISGTVLPPDVENWRERRQAEREAKRARRAGEEETAGRGDAEPVGRGDAEPVGRGDAEPVGEAQAPELSAGQMPGGNDLPAEAVATVGAAPGPSSKPVTASGACDASPSGRHRRRRRGGRHRQSNRRPVVSPQVDSPPAETAEERQIAETSQTAQDSQTAEESQTMEPTHAASGTSLAVSSVSDRAKTTGDPWEEK
jgi:hypothetical protein